LFTNLTPINPSHAKTVSSFLGEEKEILESGFVPLLPTLLVGVIAVIKLNWYNN